MSDFLSPQLSFADLALNEQDRITARAAFLTRMNAMLNFSKLLDLAEPVYPKPGPGRQPYPLEPMLRVYLLRHWFALSFNGTLDLVFDSAAARAFVGVDHWERHPPGRSTLQRFAELLEENTLDTRINTEVIRQISPLVLRLGDLREPTLQRASGGFHPGSGRRTIRGGGES